jgi:hypothetical protein
MFCKSLLIYHGKVWVVVEKTFLPQAELSLFDSLPAGQV